MIPHWQAKHEWWLEDIKFDLAEIWAFKLMIRRVAGSEMAKPLFVALKATEVHLKGILANYKKTYGHRPNLYQLKKEIENAIQK